MQHSAELLCRNTVLLHQPHYHHRVTCCTYARTIRWLAPPPKKKKKRVSRYKYKVIFCTRSSIHTHTCSSIHTHTHVLGSSPIRFVGAPTTGRINFGGGDQHPPDFHFDIPDFRPTLKEPWNPDSPTALVDVLSELMQQYRWHQHRKVLNHSSSLVRYEYTSTINKPEKFAQYYIDVVTLKAATADAAMVPPVRFVVSFPNIHADMGACPLKKVIAQNPPQIIVSYDPQPDGGMVAGSQMLIAAEATAIAGAIECPAWAGENVYLGIYIKAAEAQIKQRLDHDATQYIMRRRFIASCLSHFGTALLEYDLEHFRSIHFLFEVNAYYAVVTIALPETRFPEKAPQITLKSLHQPVKAKTPLTKVFSEGDMPYSPRWTMDEMAARTRTFLQEMLPSLQEEESKK